MRKNILLTFFFACIPGAGQMYQGYLKRGTSVMLLFFTPIAIGAALGIEVVLFLSAVVYAYAFFDTFRIRNMMPDQREAEPDDYVIHLNGTIDALFKNNTRIIGWGCIIVGVIAAWNIIIRPVYNMLLHLKLGFIADMLYNVPSVALAAALIVFGFYLLRGKKLIQQDDYVSYQGGNNNGSNQQ